MPPSTRTAVRCYIILYQVRHVRQCKAVLDLDLPDSGPAVEGEILPRWPQRLPALRLELIRVRAVEVLSALHNVDLVVDFLALLDEDGRFAIRSTAEREGRVVDCDPGISRDDGEESKSYPMLVGAYGKRSVGTDSRSKRIEDTSCP